LGLELPYASVTNLMRLPCFGVRPFHYFAIFATIYIAFADNNQTSLKNNYICLLKQNENYV
ncbi:MAG: hypothetical protein MJZ20_14055, partial [Bacteroidaceae bacterium]|nr:hypothetical protein [Bacteroidaceae bacterium]